MRAIFFGTPELAVPSLDALAEVAEVVGVVCQPDRPVGRGLALTPPPVKVRATALGLDVIQPTKLKDGFVAAWAKERAADVALVVAYGRILPPDVLAATGKGCVNVHASLLPKYRGAAPITWAIVRGEAETGVSMMLLDAGMDTGPVLTRRTLPILPDETAGELSIRIAALGALAVRADVPRFVRGELSATPQDESGATLAPMLDKKDGAIDWSRPARAIHDHVRGMSPWPGAFTTLHGRTVKVHATAVSTVARAGTPAGQVLVADKSHVLVACGDGGRSIELVRVQLEGKKAVRGVDWVMGRGLSEGDRLGAAA
jgi:methionyl-tRNA formyltransferase